MKRILQILLLVVVAFVVGRSIYRAFASDETKIGWLLTAEAAAFNAANVLDLMPGFGAEYRDATAGIDLQTLRAGVMWAWRSQRDAQGRFGWHLTMPADGIEIAVDGDTATATLPLQLHADGAPIWELRVNAQLRKRDGRWWITRSSHETTAGQVPKPTIK